MSGKVYAVTKLKSVPIRCSECAFCKHLSPSGMMCSLAVNDCTEFKKFRPLWCPLFTMDEVIKKGLEVQNES